MRVKNKTLLVMIISLSILSFSILNSQNAVAQDNSNEIEMM